MKKKSLSVAIIALSLSLTGCISPSDSQNAGVSPAYEQEGTDTTYSQPQDEENVEREEPGYMVALKIKELPISDEESLAADSTLILNSDATFTITESGITSKSAEGKKAARGEVLHAIKYESEGFAGGDINVSIDGNFADILLAVPSAGYIIVSAPADADISLGFPYIDDEGIEQVIDAKSGERLSLGIADIWYDHHTSASLVTTSWPEDVEKVMPGGSTVKLRIGPFLGQPELTAYVPELGWANAGNGAWLVVESAGSRFSSSGGPGSFVEMSCSITATDEDGNEYEANGKFDYTFTYATKYYFEVPSYVTDFDVTIGCSAQDVVIDSQSVGPTGDLSGTMSLTFKD